MDFFTSKITKSAYHLLMILWFVFIILIAIGNWTGKIRFGLGLGDLVYVAVIGIVGVLVGLYYYKGFRVDSESIMINKSDLITMAVCLIFLIFIILKMTYLRGGESKWDGRIFF